MLRIKLKSEKGCIECEAAQEVQDHFVLWDASLDEKNHGHIIGFEADVLPCPRCPTNHCPMHKLLRSIVYGLPFAWPLQLELPVGDGERATVK